VALPVKPYPYKQFQVIAAFSCISSLFLVQKQVPYPNWFQLACDLFFEFNTLGQKILQPFSCNFLIIHCEKFTSPPPSTCWNLLNRFEISTSIKFKEH
jgi:hypothetical protein